MFQQTIQITMTPDQLGELVRGAVRSELATYTPPAPEGSDLPELLTRRQTSDTLQVSLTTLHDWALDTEERSAVLLPLKINGRVRYRRVDVLAALKQPRRFKHTKAVEGRGK
ncbi:helix-turn-helix domain-containing protein [Spirosoma luteum]|uniref:helix-turn-helix domain-containing protein n=1 Tax=Spirosoma luteum TaxID=431553 RepID=UPI00037C6EAB|nr:helix-turn-helix domain-containing protein [Spirosoma luteum]